jgi:RecA-family ATPase
VTPGLGKSVRTLDLAARLTRGLAMPWEERQPGEEREPAGVVLLTAEDGLTDTVRPRLDAAGADVARVLALDGIPEEGGARLSVLPQDAIFIRHAVERMKARLVVMDPITAHLGGNTNTHRDQDVRRALYPLAVLAERTGAAVVAVRHLNKAAGTNPLYRGGGSIGIIGAGRSGLLLAKDPDNPDRRVLASTKCNLAHRRADRPGPGAHRPDATAEAAMQPGSAGCSMGKDTGTGQGRPRALRGTPQQMLGRPWARGSIRSR